VSDDRVIDEFERMWKEFKELYWQLPRGSEESHRNP
jgi:hypothetical protein